MPTVVFDLDNALVDRSAAFSRWCEAWARQHGLDAGAALPVLIAADRDSFRDRTEFLSEMRSRFGLQPQVEDLLRRFWADFPGCFACDDGTLASLARLRSAGWTIVIATNGGATQELKIRAAKLDTAVDASAISALEGVAKPDPELLRLAAPRAGAVLASMDWMVGDSEADIAAGIAAGVRTIWLARDGVAIDCRPTLIVSCLAEAFGAIESERSAIG